MRIWAIGDLHLSLGIPDKEMDIFGPEWRLHHEKIAKNWDALVQPDDLVLIPGDISWAMHLDQAQKDFEWIDARPGVKVMIKGNHDYWWSSASKIRKVLPPSLHVISNDAFFYKGVAIAGTRLWDSDEYTFSHLIEIKPQKEGKEKKEKPQEDPEERERIFSRELQRLEMSLQAMNPAATYKIAMVHYPPLGTDLKDSRATAIFEKYKVNLVLFGHLHSLKKGLTLFGEKNGINYQLTSCDFLNFTLLKVAEIP